MAISDLPKSVKLKIHRTNGSQDAETLFEVPIAGPASRVLDALLHIRHQMDPTLSFRYSCRVGMCGSCAVVVNGKEMLACQTTLASLGTGVITIDPLRSLPVQRDLAVDMTPFFDSLRNADAAFRPSEPTRRSIPTISPSARARALIESQNGCITCGACYSACEWTRTRPGYLAPAALNRLLMLSLDERDAKGPQRLRTAAQANGALRCHTLGNCSAVCPADIPLREGMQKLKGLLATETLDDD